MSVCVARGSVRARVGADSRGSRARKCGLVKLDDKLEAAADSVRLGAEIEPGAAGAPGPDSAPRASRPLRQRRAHPRPAPLSSPRCSAGPGRAALTLEPGGVEGPPPAGERRTVTSAMRGAPAPAAPAAATNFPAGPCRRLHQEAPGGSSARHLPRGGPCGGRLPGTSAGGPRHPARPGRSSPCPALFTPPGPALPALAGGSLPHVAPDGQGCPSALGLAAVTQLPARCPLKARLMASCLPFIL